MSHMSSAIDDWTATLSAKWNCCCKQPSSFVCWQLLTVSNILFTNRPIFNFWQWCWGRYSIAAEGVSVQSAETVCIFLVQASFVMQHQNAVVYVALFLAVMMLPSSFVLIFTQHINIRHVILLTHCCVSLPSVLWRCWLGGRKGIRPVKNWVVGCWRGYLSGVRCWLAYVPADATATHCLLLQ